MTQSLWNQPDSLYFSLHFLPVSSRLWLCVSRIPNRNLWRGKSDVSDVARHQPFVFCWPPPTYIKPLHFTKSFKNRVQRRYKEIKSYSGTLVKLHFCCLSHCKMSSYYPSSCKEQWGRCSILYDLCDGLTILS